MSLPWESTYNAPAQDDELIAQVSNPISTPVVGSVPSQATGAGTPAPTPTATVAPAGGDWGVLLDVLKKEAEEQVNKKVAAELADSLQKAVANLGPAPVAEIPTANLTKLDAWERAGRTFAQGLIVTILGALVTVLVQAVSTGTNFFTQDGWMAVGTLAVGSVLSATASYIMRYVREPEGAAIDSSSKDTKPS